MLYNIVVISDSDIWYHVFTFIMITARKASNALLLKLNQDYLNNENFLLKLVLIKYLTNDICYNFLKHHFVANHILFAANPEINLCSHDKTHAKLKMYVTALDAMFILYSTEYTYKALYKLNILFCSFVGILWSLFLDHFFHALHTFDRI